jgi:putative ABC transport system permease protein
VTFFETIRVALQSIRSNLLRSLLTMLGIIIGVSAVITMIAVGSGAQRAIDDQIDQMGANLLNVVPGQSFMRGVASAQRVSLSARDFDALSRDGELLAAVVPELQAGRQVKHRNRNAFIQVIGTTPNYHLVNRAGLQFGHMFTDGDNGARRRYAVLGAGVPRSLGEDPQLLLGRSITIGNLPFEVIGIFEHRGVAMGPGPSPDDAIFIPIETAQHRLLGTDRISMMAVQIRDGTSLENGMIEIERILRREHGIRPGAENDFMILNRRQILETRQAATEIFSYLLASIAGVSLLVGGIGIMNIMLVSVTERTREIGVRKALGATRGNILLQFLIESLTIGALGGIVGILAGIGGAVALSRIAGFDVFIAPEAVVMAVAFSVGIGLIFGIWPARRASLLDPIEALRHD